jgi:hypothetical protein
MDEPTKKQKKKLGLRMDVTAVEACVVLDAFENG